MLLMPLMRTFVLVLTADAASGALDDEVAGRASAITGSAGRWIAPRAAFELPVPDLSCRGLVESELAGRPVDVNIVPGDPGLRAKRLLLADMDSTMIEQELVDELAGVAGIRDEVAAITRAAMQGELDFRQSLRKRVTLLTGMPMSAIQSVTSRIRLMPGAVPLVAGMRDAGAFTALVSSGFTVFVEPVARSIGFDRAYANILGIEGGKITGQVAEPIVDAAGKREILIRLAAERGVPEASTLAVGDGANDIAMLQSAGLGVAFRAKPAVRAAMRSAPRGAVVDHAGLTALLHLQGLTAPAD